MDWNDLRRRSLQPGGFGSERAEIWPRLLNVSSSAESTVTVNVDDLPPHQDERQIQLDTDRSFVLYPLGFADRTQLQASLNALLVSVFRKHPKLHYFQGYHDIVAVLFLTLPPSLQLPCIEKLSLHHLRDSMGTGLEPVLGLVRITHNLLKLADPPYASTLSSASSLPFHALSNLLTLFAHDTPTLPLIQHIFDFLLSRPPIAVVYLAAAVILSRKQEVQKLVDEGEDGMIHSLLSGLPDLVDSHESEINSDDHTAAKTEIDSEVGGEKEREIEGGVELNIKAEEQVLTRTNPTEVDNDEPTMIASSDTTNEPPSPSGSSSILHMSTPHSSLRSPKLEPETETESDLTLVEGDVHLVLTAPDEKEKQEIDEIADKITSDYTTQEECRKVELTSTGKEETINIKEEGSPLTAPIINPTPSPRSSTALIPSSSPNPSPQPSDLPPVSSHTRLRLSLSTLLTHADTLYATYPPTHPSLHVSQIMGPQSVVHTWSENLREWPSDSMAEAMVSRPELVVYPPIQDQEEEDEATSDDTGPEGMKKERKKWMKKLRRHTRHKSKTVTGKISERQTMLAGAILVLGVAVAMYGAKNRNSASAFGLDLESLVKGMGGSSGSGGGK